MKKKVSEKYWAIYFRYDSSVCSKKAFIRLNGSKTVDAMKRITEEHNQALSIPYSAYQIVKGHSLLNVHPITEIINP